MAVYNKAGTEIESVYGLSGSELEQAYDISGNELLPVGPTDEIVVMTYNVQWFSGLNANEEMQDEILTTYEPDFIGLQELGASMPAAGTRILANYPVIEIGVQSNKTGMASKWHLTDAEGAVFENQATETRGYQKAYFRTASKKTICWINAHLETSSYESVKVAQAEELFDLVENEPYFIITGDFNTVCKSVNDTEYSTIMEQFINAGCHSANCSAQHGFIDTWTAGKTAEGTWYPCDHVITSANITIQNVIADTTKITTSAGLEEIDHIPLVAYLKIN